MQIGHSIDVLSPANVLDLGVRHLVVRNRDQVAGLKLADLRGPQSDLFHESVLALGDDAVAHAERSVQQNGHGAEEPSDHPLGRKGDRQAADPSTGKQCRDRKAQIPASFQEHDRGGHDRQQSKEDAYQSPVYLTRPRLGKRDHRIGQAAAKTQDHNDQRNQKNDVGDKLGDIQRGSAKR